MGIEEKIDLESEGEFEDGVRIQEIPIPKNEKELINYFRKLRDMREFGVQLVLYSANNQFDPEKIAQLCEKEERQKIGYICDLALSLQRYRVLRQETIRNLGRLSKNLQDRYQNWVHVDSSSELARKLAELDPKTAVNHRWKVYPGTYAEDILDWLDLYHDEYFQSGEAKRGVNKFYEERGILRLKL